MSVVPNWLVHNPAGGEKKGVSLLRGMAQLSAAAQLAQNRKFVVVFFTFYKVVKASGWAAEGTAGSPDTLESHSDPQVN